MDPPLKCFALTTPGFKGVHLFPVTHNLKGMSLSLILIITIILLFFLKLTDISPLTKLVSVTLET